MAKLEETLNAEELKLHNTRSPQDRDLAERQYAAQQVENEEEVKARIAEYQEANKAFRQVQNPSDLLLDMQRELRDEINRLKEVKK